MLESIVERHLFEALPVLGKAAGVAFLPLDVVVGRPTPLHAQIHEYLADVRAGAQRPSRNRRHNPQEADDGKKRSQRKQAAV